VGKPKPIPEDPVRLRECLEALSDACGHDVFRVQTDVGPKGGVRVIITCSRQVKELDVAKILADELIRATGGAKWDEVPDDGPEETRG